MVLCGIARFHGGLNITEKGAYRVCLWSFIMEIAFHAFEVTVAVSGLTSYLLSGLNSHILIPSRPVYQVHKGTLPLQDTKIVFIICGAAIAVMV